MIRLGRCSRSARRLRRSLAILLDPQRRRRAPQRPARPPAAARRARASSLGVARALMMSGRRLIAGKQALARRDATCATALYAKLVRLSFGFYDRHQTGQLMSRATVDLQGVRFFLGYGLIFFFQHVFTIVGVGDRRLRDLVEARADRARDRAGAGRGRLPLQPRLASAAARRAAEDGRRRDGRRGEHRRRPRRQVVRAGAGRAGRSSSGAPRRSSSRACTANRQRAFYVPLLAFLPLLAQAAILLVGGRMVAHGTLSLGDFVAFNLFLAMLVLPLRQLGMWIGAGAARDRLGRAHLPGDRRAGGDHATRPARASCRRARDASSSRASRSATTRRGRCCTTIDLELEPGTTVALIGHTGSGKTTLAVARAALLRRAGGPRDDRRRRRARRDARRRCAARSA